MWNCAVQSDGCALSACVHAVEYRYNGEIEYWTISDLKEKFLSVSISMHF